MPGGYAGEIPFGIQIDSPARRSYFYLDGIASRISVSILSAIFTRRRCSFNAEAERGAFLGCIGAIGWVINVNSK